MRSFVVAVVMLSFAVLPSVDAVCTVTACATASGTHGGFFDRGCNCWTTFHVSGLGSHAGAGIPGQGALSTSAGGSDTCTLSAVASTCSTSVVSPTLHNIAAGSTYVVSATTSAGFLATHSYSGTA